MLYKHSIKYKQNKKGTTLSARFGYKEEVRLQIDTKEKIQERLDLGNEFKNYLNNVEGLKLTSPFFACDGNDLGRHVGFYPNKKKLILKVDITTDKNVSIEHMLNLDSLDVFIARGIYSK